MVGRRFAGVLRRITLKAQTWLAQGPGRLSGPREARSRKCCFLLFQQRGWYDSRRDQQSERKENTSWKHLQQDQARTTGARDEQARDRCIN